MIPCENMYLVVKPYGVMGPPEFELLFNGNVVLAPRQHMDNEDIRFAQWRHHFSERAIKQTSVLERYQTENINLKISILKLSQIKTKNECQSHQNFEEI